MKLFIVIKYVLKNEIVKSSGVHSWLGYIKGISHPKITLKTLL